MRESFGKIALAMMALPRYRDQTLADLQHLILDPLIRDRVAIAYPAGTDAKVTDDLTGVAIWASVTPEVDAKIRGQVKGRVWPVRLKADEWNGGDITWLIDVIAPTPKATGQVIANFKSVVDGGELRLHPVVAQLLDKETLEKLGMKRGGQTMTWAMNEPRSFGEFFLDADFVGWKEGLIKAYNETLSPEERAQYNLDDVPSYFFHVSMKFTKITQHEVDNPRAMPPLRDFEQPEKIAIIHENSERFGSLIMVRDGLLLVEEGIKDVLEDMEPGIHQFWPIEIVRRDGSLLPKKYFGMRIRQFKDCFLPEQSAPEAFDGEGVNYRISSFTLKNCKALALSAEVIGGAHLWRDWRLKRPDLFLSDALVDRIKSEGLQVPNVHRVTDI